ncbi:MAG: hypothetical protein ABL921_15320 [Pirellula sp.]
MAIASKFINPYRPGAGHMPTYLAGRAHEKTEFLRLLEQNTIFENLILTGLRGVGKTVLLETLKPIAIREKWLWVGTDLSEAASLSESNIATRMMSDLALVTSSIVIGKRELPGSMGFLPSRPKEEEITLNFETLTQIFNGTPGLSSDKIKAVLEVVWKAVDACGFKGVVFAYDEAQNMSDHAAKEQYPLSTMLDVFQSIQKKGIRFMLCLVGLPTLFPKLVDSRTFSERMFHVLTLDRLKDQDSRDAIKEPISDSKCPVHFSDAGIDAIVSASGGYPYFIQFICRELFDAYLQNGKGVPVAEAARKLDSDFFMGRWSRATDRQRELLWVVASLENCDGEFTVQEVSEMSAKILKKRISPSQISQMFSKLSDAGLVYKNRHGKYVFAVPLLGQFVRRQMELPNSGSP